MSRSERLLHLRSTDDNIHTGIDSKYSSFTVTFKNPEALSGVARMEPTMIQIPNLFDNITDHNKYVTFSVKGVGKQKQLSVGYKNVSVILAELATILNTEVAAAGGPANAVTVSQNTSAYVQMINTANTTYPVVLSSTWGSIFPGLGIPLRTDFMIPSALTALPMLPNLYPPSEVLVHCVDHAQHYSMGQGVYDTSVIAHLSMQLVPYGGITVFTNSNFQAHSIPLIGRDLTTWTFKLTDGDYNDIYLPANQRVHIYTKIYNQGK
jgi:hypothetical protein